MENGTCNCETTEDLDVSKVTYWREDGDKDHWPTKPENVRARRIHTAKPKHPHCIYALVHASYVTASSLSHADEPKFPFQMVQFIFQGYEQKVANIKTKAN